MNMSERKSLEAKLQEIYDRNNITVFDYMDHMSSTDDLDDSFADTTMSFSS